MKKGNFSQEQQFNLNQTTKNYFRTTFADKDRQLISTKESLNAKNQTTSTKRAISNPATI